MVGTVAAPPAGSRLHGVSLHVWQPATRPSQPGTGPGRAQPERIGRRLRGAGNPDLAGASGARPARPPARGRLPRGAGRRRGDGRVPPFSGRQPAARPARARRDRQPPALGLGRIQFELAGSVRDRRFGAGRAARAILGRRLGTGSWTSGRDRDFHSPARAAAPTPSRTAIPRGRPGRTASRHGDLPGAARGRFGRHWRSCLATTAWPPASCLRWLYWPCWQRGKGLAWRAGFLPY